MLSDCDQRRHGGGAKKEPNWHGRGGHGDRKQTVEPTLGKDDYVQVDENPWELIRMGI